MIASVTYNTSGSAGPYTITFPFIEDTDVDVYLDGVANTAFTITGTNLTLNTAPTAVEIEIRRNTQNALYVDFSAPAPIIPEDLDTATTQAIYIAQEAKDGNDAEAIVRAAADAVLAAQIIALAVGQGTVPPPANPADDGKILQASGGSYTWQTKAVTSTQITDATTFGKSVVTATKPADAGLASALHMHDQLRSFRPSVAAARVLFNPIISQVFGG